MEYLHRIEQTHTDSRQATLTVYRTPSSRDAADTAGALTQHACVLNFLRPAAVVQAKPGVYEVRVTYGPDVAGTELRDSLLALNQVLSKILLARLERYPAILGDSAPSIATRDVIVGLHRMPASLGDPSFARSN